MIKSALHSSLVEDIKYNSMSAGVVPSSEYLIQTALITENTPSVTFDVSGLAGIYKHLKIVGTARTNRADTLDEVNLRFNGDSTNLSTSLRTLIANSSSLSAGGAEGQNRILVTYIPAANNTANTYATFVADLIDPFSSTKNKTVRAFGGQNDGSFRLVGLYSGAWYNTTAVNSILLYSNANFVAGSRFSLYGVTA